MSDHTGVIHSWVSDNPLFKSLTIQEEHEFREYARHNDPPKLEHWSIYHPVCREEWSKRGIQPINVGEGI